MIRIKGLTIVLFFFAFLFLTVSAEAQTTTPTPQPPYNLLPDPPQSPPLPPRDGQGSGIPVVPFPVWLYYNDRLMFDYLYSIYEC